MKRIVTLFVVLVVLTITSAMYYARSKLLFYATKLDDTSQPSNLPPNVTFNRVAVLGGSVGVYYHTKFDPALPTILYSHGNSGCVEVSWSYFDVTEGRCNLVCWDYRGYGRSTGKPSETINPYDLGYVVNHVARTYDIAPNAIFLFGRSMGTNVVLRYVGKHSPRRTLHLPPAIVLLTPFARLSDVIESLGVPAPLAQLCTLTGDDMCVTDDFDAYLNGKGGRALIMASQHDRITPWDGARELFEVNSSRCTLVNIGGSHTQTFRDWTAVFEFLATSQNDNDTQPSSGPDDSRDNEPDQHRGESSAEGDREDTSDPGLSASTSDLCAGQVSAETGDYVRGDEQQAERESRLYTAPDQRGDAGVNDGERLICGSAETGAGDDVQHTGGAADVCSGVCNEQRGQVDGGATDILLGT